MLQDCVAEWGKAGGRLGQQQVTRQQALSVKAVLEGCGQEQLAAVAEQVRRLLEGVFGRMCRAYTCCGRAVMCLRALHVVYGHCTCRVLGCC